ncbi:MAG: hypothetical protein LBQ46_03655 [Treponema sp.]|jgi:hypothetical protein|nr:hypothetical protein [Treponema sp.]
MELFNGVMEETLEMLSGFPHKKWDYDESLCWEDLNESELVLAKDQAFELGGGGKQGLNVTCVTTSPLPVDRDEILLYGQDLDAIKEDSDYARLSFLRIASPGEEDEAAYKAVRDIEFVKYHVFPRGFMIRINSEDCREQVRVSRRAVKAGISFKAAGFDFIKKYRQKPLVKNVKITFIAGPGFDYRALEKQAKTAAGITNALTHIMEGLDLSCSSCALKPVCDEVEGMRELHFRQK